MTINKIKRKQTKSIEEFNRELVHIFIKKVSECLDNNDKVFVGISGGNTPKPFFDIIAREYNKKIEWEKIYFFWVDERCVPSDHPDSNFGSAKKLLLNDLPRVNYFPIKGDIKPSISARDYEKILKKYLPTDDGVPCFDILLLGMGKDGHVASLFPGTDILNTKNKFVDFVWVPKLDSYRISLTLPTLNAAKSRIVAFHGSEKNKLFNKIQNTKKITRPIQLLSYSDTEDYFITCPK